MLKTLKAKASFYLSEVLGHNFTNSDVEQLPQIFSISSYYIVRLKKKQKSMYNMSLYV